MKTKCILFFLIGLFAVMSCTSDDDVTKEDDKKETDEDKNKADENKDKTTYVKFTKDYFQINSSGGDLKVYVKTDGTGDSIVLKYYRNDMIKEEESSARSTKATRGEELTGYFLLPINVNTGAHSRSMQVIVCDNTDESIADTATIIQDGASLYTSTDFSKDGEVEMLATHTDGNGIPIIIMGDGFGDRDIADGTYKTTMTQAIENVFSEQPIKALRSYFDVYMVNAVSKNNDVGAIYETAFSTTMPSDGTTEIDGDDDAVSSYYDKVLKLYEKQIPNENDVFIIVVLNNNGYAGTTYLYSNERGVPVNYSVAYCPVIDSLKSEDFRRVVAHEVVGHGFAKLADEYSYEDQGAAPLEEVETVDELHKYDWYTNVSTTNDSIKAPWSQFLTDEDYKTEKIGLYKGGYTYISGIWRPSENSMMRDNNEPFNAPSRFAIYKQVMNLGNGKTPTYQEFKAFDLANYPDFNKSTKVGTGTRTASWRDGKPFIKPKFKILRRR